MVRDAVNKQDTVVDRVAERAYDGNKNVAADVVSKNVEGLDLPLANEV